MKSKQQYRSLAKIIESIIFFILAWLWASWWMGDVLRIAYEYSFFAPDATLMLWLQQKSLGWLWIVGRVLLTLYRWTFVGGAFVALLLTLGSCLFGYCLHLRPLWRWLQWLPAAAWMLWTAHVGLNLYYMDEPGQILVFPFVFMLACALVAAIRFFTTKSSTNYYQGLDSIADSDPKSNKKKSLHARAPWLASVVSLVVMVACFALPMYHLNHRHPYMRPLTHMQVQLMNDDFEGISRTAHEHPDMSYRQMAGYYAIALARTGQLADKLFDIKFEFDTIRAVGYNKKPNQCMNYHIIDCNYHAGLIRAARHYAMEYQTMNGPSLFTLKALTKMALIDGDWMLARKYFRILKKVPFEGDFISKYEPMVEHTELIQANPEFAFISRNEPAFHTLEQLYPKPCFAGFFVNLNRFPNAEVQEWSAVACLYSKRMPDFLKRCQQYVGQTPPRAIAEGLALQAYKNPDILKVFPQLEMQVEQLSYFLQVAQPYMNDRERGSRELFNQFKGYYPYYYFFGNMRSTRQPGEGEVEHNKAGVN